MLSPESPYPLNGGGAYRTASLLHYFARFADIDLILISDSGAAAELPAGLVRSQQAIALPRHSRHVAARYWRNARRALRGTPPLVDRLAGLGDRIAAAIGERHYDVAIVEHFWCAPYAELLARAAHRVVLDLHNIESMLHERCAAVTSGLVRRGHRRFAAAGRRMEAEWFPRYSAILTASEADAAAVRGLAPESRVIVYPNALPELKIPEPAELPRVVLSGNFEYHPNIDAVEFLMSEIWPAVQERHPQLELWLVGKGDRFIRHLLPSGRNIHVTGAVEDALGEIARAQLVIAPLRAGSGTRIKILEAWAMGKAVVATPMAAEGLEARDGANLALAGDAAAFVAAMERLLAAPGERRRLGEAGRRTFETLYSWQAAWRRLDAGLRF